jgi:hypothetical protein
VDAYLRRLGRRLWLVPHRRSRVLREARDHLLAATESGMARGLTPREAEAEAAARFGPPGRITRYEVREAGVLWASVVAGVGALAATVLLVAGGNAGVRAPFDYHGGSSFLRDGHPYQSYQSDRPFHFYPTGISAVSGTDAWIVGSPARVAWHWNGSSWARVEMAPPPHKLLRYAGRPRPTETGFTAVATPAPGDVWAVGWEGPPNDHGLVNLWRPLIEHWDGHSWHVSLSLRGDGQLTDVAAGAPDDVWAIGRRVRTHPWDPPGGPMVEHWDGHAWKDLTLPWLPRSSIPTLVSASSKTDVWMQTQLPVRGSVGMLEHWDGHAWTRVPPPFGAHSLADGLTSTSASDAWAVAGYNRHGHSHPIAAHWDGDHWSIIPTPQPNTDSALYDVIAASPTNAWAVGESAWFPDQKPTCQWCGPTGTGHPAGAYYIHWDGKRWNTSPAVRVQLMSVQLALAPNGAAFGVGTCFGTPGFHGLASFIVQLRGSHWTQVRTPERAPKAAAKPTRAAQLCSIAQTRLR